MTDAKATHRLVGQVEDDLKGVGRPGLRLEEGKGWGETRVV